MPIVWPWETGSCGLTATVVGIAERPLLRVADLKDMARPSETWKRLQHKGGIQLVEQLERLAWCILVHLESFCCILVASKLPMQNAQSMISQTCTCDGTCFRSKFYSGTWHEARNILSGRGIRFCGGWNGPATNPRSIFIYIYIFSYDVVNILLFLIHQPGFSLRDAVTGGSFRAFALAHHPAEEPGHWRRPRHFDGAFALSLGMGAGLEVMHVTVTWQCV